MLNVWQQSVLFIRKLLPNLAKQIVAMERVLTCDPKGVRDVPKHVHCFFKQNV